MRSLNVDLRKQLVLELVEKFESYENCDNFVACWKFYHLCVHANASLRQILVEFISCLGYSNCLY